MPGCSRICICTRGAGNKAAIIPRDSVARGRKRERETEGSDMGVYKRPRGHPENIEKTRSSSREKGLADDCIGTLYVCARACPHFFSSRLCSFSRLCVLSSPFAFCTHDYYTATATGQSEAVGLRIIGVGFFFPQRGCSVFLYSAPGTLNFPDSLFLLYRYARVWFLIKTEKFNYCSVSKRAFIVHRFLDAILVLENTLGVKLKGKFSYAALWKYLLWIKVVRAI